LAEKYGPDMVNRLKHFTKAEEKEYAIHFRNQKYNM
jgi:hypothetical protein